MCTNFRLSDDTSLHTTTHVLSDMKESKKDSNDILDILDNLDSDLHEPRIISSQPIHDLNSIRSEKQDTPKRATPVTKTNVLDIGNWISSSDDDSFNMDVIKPVRRESLIKQVLNSSPIMNRMANEATNDSIALEPRRALRINSPAFGTKEVTRPEISTHKSSVKRLFVGTDDSDPISSSSVLSSPPRPVKARKKRTVTEMPTRGGFTDKQWRDANKVTRKKEDILGEMVIEIALCLKGKIETDHFKQTFELPVTRNTYLDIPLISWKRRVTARYNKDEDVFVPCEADEICERVLVLYYEAADLVAKIQEDTLEEDTKKALRRGKAEDPLLKHHLLIVVPGMKEYLRKLKTVEDRLYRSQMLAKMNEPVRQKTQEEVSITASEAQKLIHSAEVKLGINIFSSKSVEETIDWLHAFTYTIGAALYDKFERNLELSNLGSVKLGSDQKSTFVEMIKKFNLMTNQKAEKLYEFYTSPASLYDKFMKSESLGTVGGKNILPPTVNAAMRRVFTSTDPTQVIND